MNTSRAHGRYHAYDTGTAGYLHPGAEPPGWMVDAVPGAFEAREKWQHENSRGNALYREWRASSRALAELAALRPPSAELEAAQRAHDEKTRELKQQSQSALQALRAFDNLVLDARDDGRLTERAAEISLAAHFEAVDAFAKGFAAIARRDSARRGAGSPGVEWETFLPDPLDRLPRAERIIKVAIDHFPASALEEVAATGASSANKVPTVLLPDGRTLTSNPGGPFGRPIVSQPSQKGSS